MRRCEGGGWGGNHVADSVSEMRMVKVTATLFKLPSNVGPGLISSLVYRDPVWGKHALPISRHPLGRLPVYSCMSATIFFQQSAG